MNESRLPPELAPPLAAREPLLWLNGAHQSIKDVPPASLDVNAVHQAERRLTGYGSLLAALFPSLAAQRGVIESALVPAQSMQRAMLGSAAAGRWFVKADHALPIAGSIKARGGFYEVLTHAEDLARRAGVLQSGGDPLMLASEKVRALFSRHKVAVGSTGNLGLSIGVIASALGFRTTVHMSRDAKAWKKARLRACGVDVIEHVGDYQAAVEAGRQQALADAKSYFVDDENSTRLFLGYSAAAVRLRSQLDAAGVRVDSQHPLFVYLPCGVGGAPGGITFGLRHLLGDHVHCFFAEPVASPCVLLRLAARGDAPISVSDVGLDNRTEADGLAVGRASDFAVGMVKHLVSGVFTVRDESLFRQLYMLEQCEGLQIEPSAAAGVSGPHWITTSEVGRRYLNAHNLLDRMNSATHVIWTTGGSLVPQEEYLVMHARGQAAVRGE